MTFLSRFQAQAAARPGAPAVIEHGHTTLTYGALASRVARGAAALVARGAGPETVVGLHLRKSAQYVVAMLATWWAGAAFLPLDPDLPEARLRCMREDAGAHLCIENLEDQPPVEPVTTDPEQLAYVIYTSGSTAAKGVMVPHRGIMNLLEAQIAAFALEPASRVLWMLSTAFDASISDVGTTLACGAALCIESPREVVSRLLPLISERGITHVDLPPSMLPRLNVAQVPACLQTMVIGGEVCPPEAVRRWASRVRLVNVYGPTEATVCASLVRCRPDWDRPLLGSPLPRVTFRVVDGELWIGGIGLFRGYCNRPDLTQERLVCEGDTRWYRTGDRVRVHADDAIEFVGRFDRQVKVRGMLVQPEEIEMHLQQHPAVDRAAVLPTSTVLTAYVAGRTADRTALREHLAGVLPAWMIPSRWVFLDTLPTTASGKVCWPDLPAEGETVTESTLRRIWAEVLELQSVAGTDNFFELGGNSLLLLDMVVAAGREGLSVAPDVVYETATLAELAARVDTAPDGMDADVLRADVAWTDEWEARLNIAATRFGRRQPGAVLVTGATGSLGRQVVAELARRLDCRIYCLVRRGTAGAGETVAGDLSLPYLGLSQSTWERLVDEVDTVYHCGAAVHLLHPYRHLRPVNVGGTVEVVRFMSEGRPKRLHHASTLSVFVGTDRCRGRMAEADDLLPTRRVYGGYAQSKWAAEVLLRNTRGRAGPVNLYRFGLLTGNPARNDWLGMFVRATAALGCVPADALGLAFDITPVEHAAAAMVNLSLSAVNGTFHIANPNPATLGDLVAAMRAAGCPVELVPEPVWRERARGHAPVVAALGRLGWHGADLPHRSLDLFAATDTCFDIELPAPLPGPQLVAIVVRHLLS